MHEKSFRKLLWIQDFSINEFVKFCGKSKTTIYEWYKNDRCPYFYEYVLNNFKIKKGDENEQRCQQMHDDGLGC